MIFFLKAHYNRLQLWCGPSFGCIDLSVVIWFNYLPYKLRYSMKSEKSFTNSCRSLYHSLPYYYLMQGVPSPFELAFEKVSEAQGELNSDPSNYSSQSTNFSANHLAFMYTWFWFNLLVYWTNTKSLSNMYPKLIIYSHCNKKKHIQSTYKNY